ncbi:MAG: hypothetical protein Ta2B_25280 [Termitinemataceae bacterium]|nr:MAG: hypothetical protein Ta2B_25280 [Termitinemataceae bacterium]
MNKSVLKKVSVVCLMLVAFTIPLYAKSVKFEDALKRLEDNCKKYPYAFIAQNVRTPDGGRDKYDLTILSYDGGEYYILKIISHGTRYEFKIDFISQKMVNSIRTQDARYSVLNTMQDILPKDFDLDVKSESATQ